MTATMIETRSGIELLRVSDDKSKQERSHGEQHADNVRETAANGIELRTDAEYRETGSASAFRTKERGDFPRLLDDLRRDNFGADVLVMWESSRGSREVDEWIELLRLLTARGVTVFVTLHEREYDPRKPGDRRSLLADAIDAEYETAKMSARVRRAMAANAAAGKPYGRCPYGYTRTYDAQTKALIAQEPLEPEAAHVRELYDRLTRGESLRAIARDWQARGIRTRSGTVWQPNSLRDLALRPANAALIVHRPGAKSGDANRLPIKPGDAVKANWLPLVDETLWYSVREILTDPSRNVRRPGRGVHLLSMIGKCAECGSPLIVTYRKARKRDGDNPRGAYQCHKRGCVRIDKPELDEHAERLIFDVMTDRDTYDAMVARNSDVGGDVDAVRLKLAEARADLAALLADVDGGRVSYRVASPRIPPMEARITQLETDEQALITPRAAVGYITPGPDVEQSWREAPMSAKRELARMLLASGYLGELHVTRRPKGMTNVHVPAEARVRLVD